MKKGFTLVELIAIIIAIGIIIGILVPGVSKISEKAKMKAFQVGVQGYLKAASTDNFDRSQLNGSYLLDTGVLTNLNVYEKVDIKTTVKEDKGYIYINEKGKKFGSIYNDIYCAIIENDVVNYSSECTFGQYENGDVVYYNPETNTTCSSSNLNRENEAKSGCLKWHAFNDDVKNYYITMILDHDTSISIPYNSENNTEMLEAKTQLEEDTSTWNQYLAPRLITINEIVKITGYDINVLDQYYYLGSNSKTAPTFAEGTHPYKWLFNYTNGCKVYGCDVERTGEWGYWTSDILDDGSPWAWHIRPDGTLHSQNKVTSLKGIRPVITVPKRLLES